MLVNISIAKRKEVKAVTHPTHDIVASDEKYENKTVVGSLWTRVTQEGTKFLSGNFAKNRTGADGKKYKGYVLISQDEYEELVNGQLPKVKVDTGEVANIEEIDF